MIGNQASSQEKVDIGHGNFNLLISGFPSFCWRISQISYLWKHQKTFYEKYSLFPGTIFEMDQWTRNLMMIQKVLHLRDDINKLYVLRKKGRIDIASIEDSMESSIWRLKDYIKKIKERLITVTRNNTDSIMVNETITRKQRWEEKQLWIFPYLRTPPLGQYMTQG